jgi:hypothetical protein
MPQVLALSRKLESDALAETCRAGLRVVAASKPQVDALRAAFQPVYADLERDDAASRTVARIRELARDGGGVDTLRCPDAARAAAGIPPGTYRTILTRDDVEKYGTSWAEFVRHGPDPKALKANAIEFRLEFTEQGSFAMGPVLLSGKPVVEMDGTYSIYRDRMTITASDGTKLTMRVEVHENRLVFSDVKPGLPDGVPNLWMVHPFVKIG